jgi:hypothetical protein
VAEIFDTDALSALVERIVTAKLASSGIKPEPVETRRPTQPRVL